MVSALLEAGADKNRANDFGATPVFISAERGRKAVVSALLEAGADKSKGNAPLYMAVQNGHKAVVSALVEAGANKNKAKEFLKKHAEFLKKRKTISEKVDHDSGSEPPSEPDSESD